MESEKQKRITGDIASINRQFRNGAIDIQERSQDYIFTVHVRYEPMGKSE